MAKSIYENDSDYDGLTDAQELSIGTNPFSSDSDSDGKLDLEELKTGSLPTQTTKKEKGYELEL